MFNVLYIVAVYTSGEEEGQIKAETHSASLTRNLQYVFPALILTLALFSPAVLNYLPITKFCSQCSFSLICCHIYMCKSALYFKTQKLHLL